MCSVHRRACFAIIISHNAKFLFFLSLRRIFLLLKLLFTFDFRFLHTLTRMRTRYLDHQFQITKIKFNQRSRVPGRDQNALRGVFSLVPRDLS